MSSVEDQLTVARKIVTAQLSVRQTEILVEGLRKKEKKQTPGKLSRRPAFPVEEQLKKKLETNVKVKKGSRGGQIAIHFFSEEDLSRIAGIILE